MWGRFAWGHHPTTLRAGESRKRGIGWRPAFGHQALSCSYGHLRSSVLPCQTTLCFMGHVPRAPALSAGAWRAWSERRPALDTGQPSYNRLLILGSLHCAVLSRYRRPVRHPFASRQKEEGRLGLPPRVGQLATKGRNFAIVGGSGDGRTLHAGGLGTWLSYRRVRC